MKRTNPLNPVARLQHFAAFVFDMDGVIIDSHPVHRKAWRTFLLTLGKRASNREMDFILDGHKRNDILRHFLGDLSEAELARYGAMKDDFFRRTSSQMKPIPGVLHFLQQLHRRGIALGLATSASFDRTSSTLRRMNISHYFHAVVTGEDVSQGKPNPAVYHLARQRLNVRPSEVIAFEDAVAGVQAARHAGLRCAGVGPSRRAKELLAAGAEFVIADFTEFAPFKRAPAAGKLTISSRTKRGNSVSAGAAPNPDSSLCSE